MNKTVCLMVCKNLYCERNYKNVMKEKGVEALHADYQDLRNTPLCEGYRGKEKNSNQTELRLKIGSEE